MLWDGWGLAECVEDEDRGIDYGVNPHTLTFIQLCLF